MNNHEPQLWEVIWDVVRIGIITVFGWITWAFRKSSNRIDKLERDSIHRDEFNKTIESLRTDIKHSSTETHRRLDKLYLHLSGRKDDN